MKKRRKTTSEYYNYETNELNDKAILKGIENAREMYDNGAILEAATLMRELVDAIESFDPDRLFD